MKVSEQISEFLNFLKQAKLDYKYYSELQSEADRDITDILHEFELNSDALSDCDCIKLSRVCGEARNRRRAAKDKIEVLGPVVEFAESHIETQRRLEQLLGEIRKIEKGLKNRYYIPRGNIVENTLKEVDANGAGECAPETSA